MLLILKLFIQRHSSVTRSQKSQQMNETTILTLKIGVLLFYKGQSAQSGMKSY